MNYLFFQFNFFNNKKEKDLYLDSNFMKSQNIIPR